jgi:hypothetical protein
MQRRKVLMTLQSSSQQQAGHASASTTTVPCSCLTRSQQQQVIPAATSSKPSTLWLPLHQAQEHWGSFAQTASTSRALAAVGHAFLALSWEQSALRQYQQAMQQQRMGYTRAMDCSLEQCLCNLDAAIHHWQPCSHQLERLMDQRTIYEQEEERETIRALIMDISDFQHRLAALYEQIAQEREAFTSFAQEQSRLRASEVRP